MRLEIVPDAEAAARKGAELIAAAGREETTANGSFNLAVSGGRDPWRMLALLSDAELAWEQTAIFQVDERVAEPGSRDRNLTHIILTLSIDQQASVRPMEVSKRDLVAAAAAYDAALPNRLDLVHLGLGPDGHTASLVPDDPVLEVADRRVAVTETAYNGHRRMTLTYPALAAARGILWLVTGAEKREVLGRLLKGDRSIPAGRVENERMVVVADQAAAGDAAEPTI